LFFDLDLSAANLPIGSRLRAGGVLLEVTPKAHNGCHKFKGRFGGDALRFVAPPERRPLNLRGIYLRVVEDGEVAVGDAVEVVMRAARACSGSARASTDPRRTHDDPRHRSDRVRRRSAGRGLRAARRPDALP